MKPHKVILDKNSDIFKVEHMDGYFWVQTKVSMKELLEALNESLEVVTLLKGDLPSKEQWHEINQYPPKDSK